MRIESESPQTEAAYARLGRLVVDHGGYLHPGLVLHQQGGDLWASADPGLEGDADEVLIRVPMALLIPAAGLEWRESPELEVGQGIDRLSAPQREALAAMLVLYRCTGKLSWARQNLPSVVLDGEDDMSRLLSRVQAGSGLWRQPPPLAFIRSRILGMRADPEAPAARHPVLMPLAEILNHHPAGARLGVRPDGLSVRMVRAEGTRECHACYGYKDGLRLLLAYGYVDRCTRFVHCVPGWIDVPHLGRLQVRGIGHQTVHDLPGVTRDAEGLSLSHLNFDADKPRHALEILRFVIGGLRLPLEPVGLERLVWQAHNGLAATTLDYYRHLENLAIGDGISMPTDLVRQAVASVAARQQMLLRNLAIPG